jgi:hypothetical protein
MGDDGGGESYEKIYTRKAHMSNNYKRVSPARAAVHAKRLRNVIFLLRRK